MAWTAPITFVNGVPLTAEMLNASLRDNMNEMATAKALIANSYFVSNGTNNITSRRLILSEAPNEFGTSSTSYVASGLPPGSATVPHSGSILAMWSSVIYKTEAGGIGAGATGNVSCEVTGQVAASDAWAARYAGGSTDIARISSYRLFTGLSGTSARVRMMYSATSGTARFYQRQLICMGF